MNVCINTWLDILIFVCEKEHIIVSKGHAYIHKLTWRKDPETIH